MAVTSEPAFTGMILSDGVVGFGGPLQAIVSALTSCWGCTVLLVLLNALLATRPKVDGLPHHKWAP